MFGFERTSVIAATVRVRVLVVGVLFGVLSGCATMKPPPLPQPLRGPKAEVATDEVLEQQREQQRTRPRIESGPGVPQASADEDKPVAPKVPPIARKDRVSLVLDGVPIESFINVVYGMELGFAVQIDQSIRSRPDLISLRLIEPQSPSQAYLVAEEVLKNYGIVIDELGGVLRFLPAGASQGERPRLIATRSLPDVPAGQRVVFVAMPLEVSQPSVVAAQVRSLFGNQAVTLTEMPDLNAILISGPGDSVQGAMEAILTLDRGALRDKRSIRINPLYLPAELLAKELQAVLAGQGYTIRTGPGSAGVLTFVPVNSANALIIFSESDTALRAATEWAERLDQPSDVGDSGGVFLYSARHTTVETLVPVLEALVGGTASGSGTSSAQSAAGNASVEGASFDQAPATGSQRGGGLGGNRSGSSGGGSRASTISGKDGQLAVDPVRNVIVFQGDAQRWRAIQGVLARLDQPARQVVIEVTVAEVTLTDEFSHGIEWALRNVSVDGMRGPLGALAGLSSPTGGLVWTGLSSSGQVRAVLNLFAKDSRVSILSTPRILVKSGEVASIDVGTEVPIITSQATAPDLNDGSILQSIQYRKTGVLLEIEAVVHSGQRVDLKLSQEVSEAAATDTSDISSPSIFSRRLQTSLSLQDGESTLLGGLISSTRTDGKTKVPLLGDIPVIGRAFQNRRREGTRTELLMLITPYVIEDASQARAITGAIRSRFGTPDAWPSAQPPVEPDPRPAPQPSVPADPAGTPPVERERR